MVTTHAIQYYAPFFQLLSKEKNVSVKVFYTWGGTAIEKFDPGFKKTIEWDLPLFEGYSYDFLTNTAVDPGTHHFRGIRNIDAASKIQDFHPHVILVYGWSWQSHLTIIRHFAGKVKIWFRGDSTNLDRMSTPKRVVRQLLLRWIYNQVDLAFYVGTANKQYFEHFGLKGSQLRFAPHAVDNNRFSVERKDDVQKFKEMLVIPGTGTIVLFAGKLEEKKDPFVLLEAFEQLIDENIFLLFVGNGILEDQLKAQSQLSKKRGNIRFMNFQNQSLMPVVYQAASIFCLPSAGPGETWGLAVNEAMAAGKAIVVSDKVGCAIDLVHEGVNGYIFKNRDSNDLAQKLHTLVCQPNLILQFGEASKKIIENWSFNSQVSSILEALKNVS